MMQLFHRYVPALACSVLILLACLEGTESTYIVHNTRKTWGDARAACQAACGDLATISDAAENAEVQRIWQAAGSDRGEFWIGLTDVESEGTWVWVSGTAVSYTNWASGEPNNYRGVDENCVGMVSNRSKWIIGRNRWNDWPCSHQFPYICEFSTTTCGNGVRNED